MPIDLPVPAVIAHRGFSSIAPENTLPAFLKAVEIGVDGIELDVQLSVDNELLVFHDSTLDRTTDGTGEVTSKSLDQLNELDAGSWFSNEFKGVRIPTLEEIFAVIPEDILINVELKSNPAQTHSLPRKVAELINQTNNEEQVLISSFNIEMLKEFHRLFPDVKIGLLAQPSILGFVARNFRSRQIHHDALHPYFLDVSKRLINRYNLIDKRIHTYTVNKEQQMRKLYQMGVHAIFTDFPDLAMKIRSEVFA